MVWKRRDLCASEACDRCGDGPVVALCQDLSPDAGDQSACLCGDCLRKTLDDARWSERGLVVEYVTRKNADCLAAEPEAGDDVATPSA